MVRSRSSPRSNMVDTNGVRSAAVGSLWVNLADPGSAGSNSASQVSVTGPGQGDHSGGEDARAGERVKLGSVVTDIMGVTGRVILEAMVEGEEDPQVLAGLARGSLRRKRGELAEVVPGLIRDHHRFLLKDNW